MSRNTAYSTRQAKVRAMLDLIRLQKAPVGPAEDADKLLHEIETEVASLGLPESDAVWFYRKMQRDGWTFSGVPITNWSWTVQNWNRHKFFPSQRQRETPVESNNT